MPINPFPPPPPNGINLTKTKVVIYDKKELPPITELRIGDKAKLSNFNGTLDAVRHHKSVANGDIFDIDGLSSHNDFLFLYFFNSSSQSIAVVYGDKNISEIIRKDTNVVDQCTCDYKALAAFGCKCGFIERERKRQTS